MANAKILHDKRDIFFVDHRLNVSLASAGISLSLPELFNIIKL